MKPLLTLVLALGGLIGFPHVVFADQPKAEKRRPNILLIYTDDQTWRTLSCYQPEGAWSFVRTPNIDRLAKEGVRFQYAYGAAWCTPSRACLLTGLYPHGIQGLNISAVLKGSYDPRVCRFWPAALRKAGYHTAMIGKWHIGHDAGHGRDWDHSVVWDQADIKGDWYNDQLLSIDGAAKKVVPGYSTDVYSQFAVDYVKRAHQSPWLLWLCYNAPHLPNTVHPRHRERYRDAEVPIPDDVFGPRPGKPRYMQNYTQWQRGADEKAAPLYRKQPLPEVVRDYNRLVCALDEGVGKILKALEESRQLDDTLIVFTSDQGFAWGEHGFAWKVGPYEACLRMPLIIRWPKEGARDVLCRRPVALVDLPPTLFALAGVPLPWEMHGHDLRPLLKDPAAEWDHPVLLEHFRWEFGSQTDRGLTENASIGGIPWWISLRHGRLKYVRTLVPDEIEELYDLEADPHERKNLALDAAQAKRLAEYRERLLAELKRTRAGLLKTLPPPRQ